MRVLLAPDKFKGTLTSAEVASHLAGGLRAARPDVETDTALIADGGDGLLDAFESAGFERVRVHAANALGAVASSAYVRRGEQAVIELAEVAGLAACGSDRAPLTATSRGVGEVIAAALDAGCRQLLLGIGGSASTDGGIGMIQALGARVRDSSGGEAGPGGLGAIRAVAIDLTSLHPALTEARLEIACDVDNPLTGPVGAAAVYGPQKGADPEQVQLLDSALGRWADLVSRTMDKDLRATAGAGAAGGVGYAALSLLGADLRPGAQLVLDLLNIPASIARADLVITGEGSLDEQTLRGKAGGRRRECSESRSPDRCGCWAVSSRRQADRCCWLLPRIHPRGGGRIGRGGVRLPGACATSHRSHDRPDAQPRLGLALAGISLPALRL
jgi:glycerate 2-kinase